MEANDFRNSRILFNAFAFLFGQGGAARAMIRLGSGNRDEAERIMGNSVLSILLSGTILTVVIYAYSEPIMFFLGASSTSIDAAVTYMRIYTLGAAVATVLSQLLIAVLCIWYLTGKKSSLTLRLSGMKLKWGIIAAIVTLGFSPFLMQITESVLNVAVDASAQRYGGDISALGITLAVSLSMVIWMPSSGINQGAQALLSVLNFFSRAGDVPFSAR